MGICAYVCTGPTKLKLEAFVEQLAPYIWLLGFKPQSLLVPSLCS